MRDILYEENYKERYKNILKNSAAESRINWMRMINSEKELKEYDVIEQVMKNLPKKYEYFLDIRNYKLDVRIARFHNIFGPYGTYKGGKEKAPAAISRKISEVLNGDEIEVWGDGEQTRSFLYIDECLEGVIRLMDSKFTGPVNIGSDEMVTINQLVRYVTDISGKEVYVKHIDGPTGVRGRNSDNKLINEKLAESMGIEGATIEAVRENISLIEKSVERVLGQDLEAKLLHYTLGTPCFKDYTNTPMASEWHKERTLINYCEE